MSVQSVNLTNPFAFSSAQPAANAASSSAITTSEAGIASTTTSADPVLDPASGETTLDVAAILAMLMDMLNEIKKASRQVAKDSAQAASADLMAQAKEIEEGAKSTFIGDIISNGITAIGGAIALGYGMKSFKQAGIASVEGGQIGKLEGDKLKPQKKLDKAERILQATPNDAQALKKKQKAQADIRAIDVDIGAKRQIESSANNLSQGYATRTQAITLTGQAVGGIASAAAHYAASAHQVTQTNAEAAQQLHQYSADEAKQILQTLGELLDKLVQTVSAINTAETDTIRSVWQA